MNDDIIFTPKLRKSNIRPTRLVVSNNRSYEVESIHSPITGSPRPSRQRHTTPASGSVSVDEGSPGTGASPNLLTGSPQLIPSSATSGNPSVVPRSVPTIKDYEIIKPISKGRRAKEMGRVEAQKPHIHYSIPYSGAFGSVFLAKKRLTGDYYAIKVLKKADMIAKNQVTNIKAERMILTQIDSPFVVNLYFSFQSKEYLYLVMEYLSGGDCAALIKAMGSLDEHWAKQYIAEVTLGLEFLHSRGIVHR